MYSVDNHLSSVSPPSALIVFVLSCVGGQYMLGASFLHQEQCLSALKPAFIDCLAMLYMLGLGAAVAESWVKCRMQDT